MIKVGNPVNVRGIEGVGLVYKIERLRNGRPARITIQYGADGPFVVRYLDDIRLASKAEIDAWIEGVGYVEPDLPEVPSQVYEPALNKKFWSKGL